MTTNSGRLISLQPNGSLAEKLRVLGLGKIVDSSKVRKLLGLPVHGKLGGGASRLAPSASPELLWQRLQRLREGAEAEKMDIQWLRQLATAESEMGNYSEAVAVWKAIQAFPTVSPEDCFAEAHAHHMAGEFAQMSGATLRGEELARTVGNSEIALLGLGGYYQRRGDWDYAAVAYADAVARAASHESRVGSQGLVELAYRAGLAHDRCLLWTDAERYYRLAGYLDPVSDYKVYKLGLALERQERWVEAAEAFAEATLLAPEKKRKYLRYRESFCLFQAEDYEGACAAFQGGVKPAEPRLPRSTPDLIPQQIPELYLSSAYSSQHWITKALAAAGAEDWSAESEYLGKAIDRSSTHPTALYERAGEARMRDGSFKEAASLFVQSRLFKRPDGLDMKPFSGVGGVAAAARYAEYRETASVRQDVVLFESYHGAKINCHPYALFQSMASDKRFAGHTFVWSLRRGEAVPPSFEEREDVVIAERESDLYLRYLAVAGTVITNVSFPPYFVRRAEQKYLNTWHGTPIKSLGRDIKPGYLEHANVARNFLQATHIISPCSWTTEALLDKYDVRALFTGSVAEIGSPRSDSGLKASEARRQEVRRDIGIPADMPVVLYAPTWRGTQGAPGADVQLTNDAISQLDALNGKVTVLFRGHHYAEAELRSNGLGERLVPDHIDTNELLSVVDVLITDYSSIFFDFLPYNRPIVFLTPDEEEYNLERGLYFTVDDLPGVICRSVNTLSRSVEQTLQYVSSPSDDPTTGERVRWLDRYAPHEDGNASSRALDFLLDDLSHAETILDTTKPLVLLRSSLLPNGITTSARNLVHSIDSKSAVFVNINDPAALKSDRGRKEQFDLFSEEVIQLGRVGAPCFTPEERWVITSFNRTNRFFSDEHRRIAHAAYRKEFVRICGSVAFDAAVEFDGYAPFWVNLLGAAENISQKVIYQHNDLFAEWTGKYPELSAVFSGYSLFDQIVSVSPSVGEINRTQIAARFGLDDAAFTNAKNQINPNEILERSKAEVDQDIINWLARTNGHLFVSMGRLSIEKGHSLLLESFALATKEVEARLVIIGSGFLLSDLQSQADKLGIKKKVFFAGQRVNPMGILKLMDTFVLTSSHEGQPMVLGEALMLGIPVISTDLPGTRDMLGEGLGQLVGHDSAEIANAMIRAVSQRVSSSPKLDTGRYMLNAVDDFSRVCRVPFELDGSTAAED